MCDDFVTSGAISTRIVLSPVLVARIWLSSHFTNTSVGVRRPTISTIVSIEAMSVAVITPTASHWSDSRIHPAMMDPVLAMSNAASNVPSGSTADKKSRPCSIPSSFRDVTSSPSKKTELNAIRAVLFQSMCRRWLFQYSLGADGSSREVLARVILEFPLAREAGEVVSRELAADAKESRYRCGSSAPQRADRQENAEPQTSVLPVFLEQLSQPIGGSRSPWIVPESSLRTLLVENARSDEAAKVVPGRALAQVQGPCNGAIVVPRD